MVFTGVPTNLAYDFAAEVAPTARAYVFENAPKGVLVAAARGYAFAHHLGQGAISGLVSAAIMAVWRASGRPGPANLRGNSTVRLPPRSKPRPMDRAPKRLAIADGSVSGNKTALKRTGRASTQSTGLEIVERPLRIQKSLKGDAPKSVWSSLRDLVTGKKVLKNTFSFKMSSERDKRGLMAIPIRHDANLPMSGTASGWTVGSQTVDDVPAADGFGDYSTMLKVPKQEAYAARPLPSAANVIIPRMNLPTLEQTSWDLNNMKLLPTDNLMKRIENNNGVFNAFTMVQPVVQLGGSAVPYNANQPDENQLINNYPSATSSYARKQSVYAPTGDPVKGTLYQMPRFKTQIGGGSLKMRMCNQGTNSCTVEFVVVKVANPYLSTFDPSTNTNPDQITNGGARCNMTKTWANLYDTVGWEHSKKVQSNLSYKMGEQNISLEDLQLEPINNPYKPWLPDSCFKGHYDNTNQYGANDAPYNSGGLYHDQGATGLPTTDAANPLHAAPFTVGPIGQYSPFNKTGGGGQKTPYRVVNRGHCTIAGAAERDVTIPFPGSNYDASKIQSIAQNLDVGVVIDSAYDALCSDQSYIVLVSVNGSLQDIIEPQLDATTGESTGNIKVIGKSYTAATVDFYCQYTETVYPSHCDYAAIGPVAYNVGTARTGMLKSSLDAYPGKVMPMADAVPVTQAGVLRTGNSDRAGDNAGSKT